MKPKLILSKGVIDLNLPDHVLKAIRHQAHKEKPKEKKDKFLWTAIEVKLPDGQTVEFVCMAFLGSYGMASRGDVLMALRSEFNSLQ